ncbi:RusA family crossover junction endodeoxyribonuclease [Ramlibacter sp.]|uniref:RusA family crossover junction endodeoxyribonuclease n=1 Tax=Ramlibacter sp. TaxID=1917967 RepID=UPI003D0D83FE
MSANAYWGSRVVLLPKPRAPIVQTFVTHEARKYRETVGWMLRAAGVRATIPGRVRVDIQLRPHCPQDWKKRARKDPLWWADTVQRLDIDNCRKVLLDAMKGIVFEDDKQVWRDSGEVMEPEEGVEACVVVRISRAVKDEPQGGLAL